jgi:PAS domain S-box-containing protein
MLSPRKIKVLIIDDDEDDFFIIAGYINDIQAGKFIIDWCNNYQEALKKFRTKEYDIYFVDYRLGNQTGLELLHEMAGEKFNDPIVLLTGKGSKDIDIKAMQSGATDYLVKSELNTEKLERCIRYSLDRTASLKELKARENKYRNLFEGSKDAVVITNAELIMLEVNHAASQLFELSMTELAGKTIYDFIRDEQLISQLKQQVERKDIIEDLEIEIEDAGNEIHSCLLSMTFQEQSSGELLIHAIIHDITNIKKAEIANLQAQKLAANERLMRILAHEIRNPLNNISLSIDHFDLPEENNETQRNLVSIIKRNCIRINHIITELLDLTKPHELTFKTHSLQEILDESIALVSDKSNLRQITISRSYPELPLEISANKSKLVIAFTNILLNAVEATQENTGEICVAIKETGNTYHVSIKDNGAGIPAEYLSKLFEPFFTMKKNGVGLGLAASYSIIQSHKASMRVESEVDKGTNFIISFNAAELN